MGVLYNFRVQIDKCIETNRLDASEVRGKISLQTGFLVSLITSSTADDPVKIAKFRKAAETVLHLKLQ